MKYTLLASRTYDKALAKLPVAVQTHLEQQIFQLEEDPYTGKPLKQEFRGFWSLHTRYLNSDYRVIYRIDETRHHIELYYVGSRENLYQRVHRLDLKKFK